MNSDFRGVEPQPERRMIVTKVRFAARASPMAMTCLLKLPAPERQW